MDKLERILSEVAHLHLGGQIVHQTNITKLGSTCEVYRAWSNKHMKSVAVKQIREFVSKDAPFAKRLAKEIKVWASLDHENVLPLLGYFTVENNKIPRLVSEWMQDGTMTDYMKMFPRCSFETQKMLFGIASGLAYLHDNCVIHGDLKTANVLISKDKFPLLTDFGLSTIIRQSQSTTQSVVTSLSSSTYSVRGTVRWMARDFFIIPSDTCDADEATDVWAYGMVIYEMLTWDVPYADKVNDLVTMFAIAGGELPAAPSEVGEPGIFKKLWDLCQQCWEARSSRPTATKLAELTNPATNSVGHLDTSDEESNASIAYDDTQHARKDSMALIEDKLSSLQHLDLEGEISCYRRSFGAQAVHHSSGSYELHNLHFGWSNRHKRAVVIRNLRISCKDTALAKKLTKEIGIWASLRHEHVFSPLGYLVEGKNKSLSMVYEWIERNSLHEHNRLGSPRGGPDTWRMLKGIASGLEYIHGQGVINAGLRSHNILISPSHEPMLVGFDVLANQPLTVVKASVNHLESAVRWMAVELLDCESHGEYTKETDVWAFGMVAYELLSGSYPYHEYKRDDQVISTIVAGVPPQKPTNMRRYKQFDPLWEMCEDCWEHNPIRRPTAARLHFLLSPE